MTTITTRLALSALLLAAVAPALVACDETIAVETSTQALAAAPTADLPCASCDPIGQLAGTRALVAASPDRFTPAPIPNGPLAPMLSRGAASDAGLTRALVPAFAQLAGHLRLPPAFQPDSAPPFAAAALIASEYARLADLDVDPADLGSPADVAELLEEIADILDADVALDWSAIPAYEDLVDAVDVLALALDLDGFATDDHDPTPAELVAALTRMAELVGVAIPVSPGALATFDDIGASVRAIVLALQAAQLGADDLATLAVDDVTPSTPAPSIAPTTRTLGAAPATAPAVKDIPTLRADASPLQRVAR